MSSATQKLVNCLEEAAQLIPASVASGSLEPALTHELASDHYVNLALFEKLAFLTDRNASPVSEPVRIMQHLSCTGGSLFAKCIASMPNTILLSEISPLSTLLLADNKSLFLPSDFISLSRQAKTPAIDELSEKIFLAELRVMENHLQERGLRLVLREHSHSTFLTGTQSNPGKTIRNILSGVTDERTIVTVRHPIDSYLSLQRNKWVHFDPKTFDEYCKRYLGFLDRSSGLPIFKYEHLVENPEEVMQKICGCLEIPFNKDFLDYLEIIYVTGDSGRRSHLIGHRDRRPLTKAFLAEAKASKHFSKLCELMDYETV